MRRSLAFAAAVLVLLAGCSGATELEQEPSSTSPSATTETSAPAPAPETSTSEPEPETETTAAEPVAGEVPAQCLAATRTQTEGDPIAAAAETAVLPAGVTLHIGTQVIPSTDVEGSFDAVSRICSAPLSDAEHRAVATEIARAIYVSGAGDSLASLRVTSWVPDGDTVADVASLRDEDYGMTLWDSTTANLDAVWKSRDQS